MNPCSLSYGDRVDPNTVEREPRGLDEERVRAFLRRRIPLADGERRLAKVCLYTNTPDTFFIIDRVPDAPVVYASACSGHGFKFASAIGELLAGMASRDERAPTFHCRHRASRRWHERRLSGTAVP